MVAAGHSWSSIKDYTLSEIGVFFKTIILQQREIMATELSTIWMGNNLSQEGLKETLKSMGVKNPKKIEPTNEEVTDSWMKLAGALRGAK